MEDSKLLLIYENKGRGISDRLVRYGYHAIVSDDGFKAIEKFKKLDFAAVVVVIKSSKHLEAVDFINDIREAKKLTPIIIINGVDDTELKLNSDTGNIHILGKPNKKLGEKVEEIIVEHGTA